MINPRKKIACSQNAASIFLFIYYTQDLLYIVMNLLIFKPNFYHLFFVCSLPFKKISLKLQLNIRIKIAEFQLPLITNFFYILQCRDIKQISVLFFLQFLQVQCPISVKFFSFFYLLCSSCSTLQHHLLEFDVYLITGSCN